MKLFDFWIIVEREGGFEALFSRVWGAKSPPPETAGLWWCHAKTPSSELVGWSEPVHIMTAEDRGWHAGPSKPAAHYGRIRARPLFDFFDGLRNTGAPGPVPFTFTLGCLEIDDPHSRALPTLAGR